MAGRARWRSRTGRPARRWRRRRARSGRVTPARPASARTAPGRRTGACRPTRPPCWPGDGASDFDVAHAHGQTLIDLEVLNALAPEIGGVNIAEHADRRIAGEQHLDLAVDLLELAFLG